MTPLFAAGYRSILDSRQRKGKRTRRRALQVLPVRRFGATEILYCNTPCEVALSVISLTEVRRLARARGTCRLRPNLAALSIGTFLEIRGPVRSAQGAELSDMRCQPNESLSRLSRLQR
jgi:hypothetical protein